jgi:RNA polymerase sigma factor (sigma-70 family)
LAKKDDTVGVLMRRDSDAFASLVERYGPLVSHVVQRMVFNQTDAEDVYQDVMTKIYEGLPAFRFESKLSTWIARIAYNTCINQLQKKRELLFGEVRGWVDGVEGLVSTAPGPDRNAERADLLERLEIEVQRMPVQFRTILTLYHLEDMSYREIGEVMNLPEGTVKSYLFRARKFLRERLMTRYGKEDLQS